MSGRPIQERTSDLLIVGGGLGGVAAALAALQPGASASFSVVEQGAPGCGPMSPTGWGGS